MQRALSFVLVLSTIGCASEGALDGTTSDVITRDNPRSTLMTRAQQLTVVASARRERPVTPPACVPTSTCPSAGACGPMDDGCGGTLDCGSCAWPMLCGAVTAGVCGGVQPLNYEAARNIPVGGSPSAVAAADVDADGRMDLVVSLFSSDGIAVLRGDGAGRFTSMPRVASGRGPKAVAVLDVTQDGLPDVVVAHAIDSTIVVLANVGGAQLVVRQTIPAGVQPMAMVALDVDHDGRMDVAAALGDGHVAVMRTLAGGGLGAPSIIPAGVFPTSISASDVDGDGDMDLVVANQMGDSITVLTNDGLGGFTPAAERAAGQEPVGVTSLEMSAGARPSMLVANRDMGMLHLLRPDGVMEQVVLGVAPRALWSADLDGDTHREAAVAHADGIIMIVKPNAQGGLSTLTTVRAGTGPVMITSRDVNGDGRPDLITANGGSNDVTVHLNAAL